MKIIYSVNYSGYIHVLRSILLLLKNNTLTFPQLGAYIFFVMQSDFDLRHKNYGVILRNDKQLAEEFNVNTTTIYRYRKVLIKKGLLIEKDGITKIVNYHLFHEKWIYKLAKCSSSSLLDLFTKTQENIAIFENLIANLQEIQPQKAAQRFNVPSSEYVSSELSEADKEFIDKELMNV